MGPQQCNVYGVRRFANYEDYTYHRSLCADILEHQECFGYYDFQFAIWLAEQLQHDGEAYAITRFERRWLARLSDILDLVLYPDEDYAP